MFSLHVSRPPTAPLPLNSAKSSTFGSSKVCKPMAAHPIFHQLRAAASVCITSFFICLHFARVSPVSSASWTIQEHLNRFNKPAITTIESPDGDVIDCVLISHQPAFDHPLLKEHRIQMQPSFPEELNELYRARESSLYNSDKLKGAVELGKPQLWHTTGSSCPHGTIPVRRTRERDLLRTKNMEKYGRKFHAPPTPSSVSSPLRFDETGHEHAIAYVQGGRYYGAKANINVWNPMVQVPSEFSLSQIWILGGSFQDDLNSIEAGWQVSPDLYGDNNTRLFIYWTGDAYQETGCYNLLCSGFVQVSSEIAMGATISPISNYGGSQYEIIILLWKDPKYGNWWMQFGDKHIVGYWPSILFSSLSKFASMVEWGGEVVNSQSGGQHTKTQMGSGHFLPNSFSECSYIYHLQVVDENNTMWPPGIVSTFADKSACYDVQTGFSSDWGNYLYYGGSGRNINCP